MADFFDIEIKEEKSEENTVDAFTKDTVTENKVQEEFKEGKWIADGIDESEFSKGNTEIAATGGEYEVDNSNDQIVSEELEPEEEIAEEVVEATNNLVAMLGDNSYEVPADAKIKAKVDGEEVEVSIEELKNNYSGAIAWDKKFTDLDKERSEYKQELEAVNTYMTEFAKKSQEDKVGALELLAQAVGLDPLEYRKQLRNELITHYSDYMQMNEDQRERFEIREELDYRRKSDENRSVREKELQALREQEMAISKVRQAHNIDDDMFNRLREDLDHLGYEVSPENISALNTQYTQLDRIDNVLENVSKGFSDDTEKVKALYQAISADPNVTDEQLHGYAEYRWKHDKKNIIGKTKVETKKQTKKAEELTVKRPAMNKFNFF